MTDDLKYQDIVDRLNDMADTVAEACIPDGRREGSYWRGDLHGKISVHIKGSRVGMVGAWQGQFGDKTGGNLIRLIELAFGCDSHGEAVRIAKEKFLGIRKRELTAEEKRKWAQQQEASKKKAEKRRQDEQREQERAVETVRSIWHEAVPIAGTPAEAYLNSRSIFMPTWPASLRFHRGLRLGMETHMALVGGVQAPDRKLVAVWRIFIGPDGRALTDASGRKLKLGFGPATGGAVRLGPVGETLRVAEGVETSLAVQLLTRGTAPVWSLLSTSGMIGFEIPAGVKRLEIYADGDRHRFNDRTAAVAKPPGIEAAEKLRAKATGQGIEAVIFPSPEPDDWLDVWEARYRDEQQQRAIQYSN